MRRRGQRVSRGEGGAVASRARAAPPLHALLQLQQLAGNAAVTLAVQRLGTAPKPFTPRDGVITPAESGIRADLGSTRWGAGGPPPLSVEVQSQGGKFRATPSVGPAGAPDILARYPAPGVYPVGRSRSGTIYGLISSAVSDLVKAGEKEHVDDADLAQRTVYGAIESAVTRLRTKGSVVRPTEEKARADAVACVKRALPARLRWTGDAPAAAPQWRGAVAALMAASVRRDTAGWHSMTSRRASYEETVDNGRHLDQGDALVVIERGGEIGQHPPKAFIAAAYQERILGAGSGG